MTELKIVQHSLKNVFVKDIKFDQNNPNKMSEAQLEALRYSLRKFGQLKPPIIDQDNVVCDGEHQVRAYQAEGVQEIQAFQVVCSPAHRRLIRQAMNKLSGTHDEQLDADEYKALLASQDFGELSKLLATSEQDLMLLINEVDAQNNFLRDKEENFDSESALKQPKYKIERGDIYQCGLHRVMCGDSTMSEDVSKLMGGEKADMVFTDPPYGVDYSSKNVFLNTVALGYRIEKDILGDTPEVDMGILWEQSFTNVRNSIKEGASFYITFSGDKLLLLLQILEKIDLKERQILVWVKNNHVLGRSTYNYKHEFILFGWKKGAAHQFNPQFDTTVWEVDKPTKNDLHPTMKPIELMEKAILNSSQPLQFVLDLFGGSGSTLIACEKTNRKCLMMEIDSAYLSVILERWENFTGKKAVKL